MISGSSQGARKTGLGKLEIGQKGTLLLDEITQMPLGSAIQACSRCCRTSDLYDRAIPSRSTLMFVFSRPAAIKLDRALAEKRLDTDLYYRLSAFTVHVPALRQRKEEIKLLLRYTMHKVAKHYGLPPREFTQSALDACQNHSWPGNLRELESLRQSVIWWLAMKSSTAPAGNCLLEATETAPSGSEGRRCRRRQR